MWTSSPRRGRVRRAAPPSGVIPAWRTRQSGSPPRYSCAARRRRSDRSNRGGRRPAARRRDPSPPRCRGMPGPGRSSLAARAPVKFSPRARSRRVARHPRPVHCVARIPRSAAPSRAGRRRPAHRPVPMRFYPSPCTRGSGAPRAGPRPGRRDRFHRASPWSRCAASRPWRPPRSPPGVYLRVRSPARRPRRRIPAVARYRRGFPPRSKTPP